MGELSIQRADPASLHELRRRVLRENNPAASVDFPGDHEATSLHFAGVIDGRVVVSASFYLEPAPVRPELVSYQLRFMAVDVDAQGKGYGAAVLDEAQSVLRALGAQQLWANARDSALGFYVATGWTVIEGSANISSISNLPHTKITKVIVAS